jgi:uncharacterized protein (DUF1697 family)
VALLRGINVGGNNLIKMSALKECLEAQGFGDVATYIASGNVMFTTARATREKLERKIEAALDVAFAYTSSVVLRTHEELREVVARAPKGFGGKPDKHRYDVIFLKDVTAVEAMKSVRTREGVDEAWAGDGVLYFSRITARAAQSLLPKLVSMPVYKRMTIRNWNTTTALLKLMEARG